MLFFIFFILRNVYSTKKKKTGQALLRVFSITPLPDSILTYAKGSISRLLLHPEHPPLFLEMSAAPGAGAGVNVLSKRRLSAIEFEIAQLEKELSKQREKFEEQIADMLFR
jgi:hypothetical protein